MPNTRKHRETVARGVRAEVDRLMADALRDDVDLRSVCVIVEPIFGRDVMWHAMGFVGGKTVNDVTGSDRTTVLDDTLCAIAAAGVEVEAA